MPPTHDSEPTLEESIATVLKTLPAPIREYVVAKKYEVVVSNLSKKYELHIDQAGTLERNIVLLLLGVNTPDEFSESLETEAGIPKEQVYKIIEDLNDQIFVPLRDGVRAGNDANEVPQPPKSAGSAIETPVPPPPPEGSLSSLPPKSALPRPSVSPAATVPAVAPSRPSVPPPAHILPKPKPSINKLQGWRSDEVQAPVPAPMMQPTTEKAPAAPASVPTASPESTPMPNETTSVPPAVPRTAPPPPNLPGVVEQSAPIQKPPVPLTKSYAADPYREPIDEA